MEELVMESVERMWVSFPWIGLCIVK